MATAKRRAGRKNTKRTRIECYNPATGEHIGTVPALDAAQVADFVKRAKAAQLEWGRSSFAQRRRLLAAIMRHVLENIDELCDEVVRDAGKTRENALLGEIWPICEKLRYTIATGEQHLRPERVSSGLLVHKVATIEYHPLGVIGVICPWNFPLQNVLGPTISALMAGNAVVAKVSEWTSGSAERIQRVFDETLAECGAPPDLVRVITGYGETGAALITSGVDHVIFTGSRATGHKVLAEAAKTLTPVTLELGGKDPLIICDDADLEQALHATLAGTMICAGQMCLAAERLYVFDGVYERFVEALVSLVAGLKQSAPGAAGRTDVGAITMPAQIDIIQALVDDAVSKGATLRCGGTHRREGDAQFFAPTVLTDVDHSMRIMREETFGPVIAIARVHSEEEAVRMANDTVYGLGSSVFSRDRARAERIARRIRAGSSCINDYGLAYMAQDLPFGGVGGSGYGRLNGRDGLRSLCLVKSVLSDRLPLHRANKVFPVTENLYERARAVICSVYDRRPTARATALLSLLRRN
jgi:acyl-CoA reductase-like NAD-dependent aldehyde dehydrogenase